MHKNKEFISFLNNLKTNENKGLIESVKKGFMTIQESYEDGESSNTKYANIIFLQGSEADEVLEILDERGVEDAARYLSDWDNGEYYEQYDEKPWGTRDRVVNVSVPGAGDYILSYNKGLETIGLSKVITE